MRSERLFLTRGRVGKEVAEPCFGKRWYCFLLRTGPAPATLGVSRERDLEALELYLQLQYSLRLRQYISTSENCFQLIMRFLIARGSQVKNIGT
jgi:hypothetical protein